MRRIVRTVVPTELSPLSRAAGRVDVHEAQLDGDEDLPVGQRIEVLDEGGNYYPAEVAGCTGGPLGPTWTIRLLCDARVWPSPLNDRPRRRIRDTKADRQQAKPPSPS